MEGGSVSEGQFRKQRNIKKANQAKIRAAYITKHLKIFCEKYYPHLLNVLDTISVIPLVIIDGHYGVGQPVNGIGILDICALQHFIRDGKIKFFGNAGTQENHKYSVNFYRNLTEAENIFPKYALEPTVVKVIEATFKMDTKRIDILGPATRPIAWTSWEADQLNSSSLKAVLSKLTLGKLEAHGE